MARSNRQLTQFAVDRIKGHLMAGPVAGASSAGNTEVEVDTCDCGRPPHLVVRLFNKEIARIFLSPLSDRVVVGALFSSGDFYDSKGRPSRTTRERLNGILDFLCCAGFFPDGVRVFIREDGYCCIGKGDAAKVFDASNPKVAILAHPSDLVLS